MRVKLKNLPGSFHYPSLSVLSNFAFKRRGDEPEFKFPAISAHGESNSVGHNGDGEKLFWVEITTDKHMSLNLACLAQLECSHIFAGYNWMIVSYRSFLKLSYYVDSIKPATTLNIWGWRPHSAIIKRNKIRLELNAKTTAATKKTILIKLGMRDSKKESVNCRVNKRYMLLFFC